MVKILTGDSVRNNLIYRRQQRIPHVNHQLVTFENSNPPPKLNYTAYSSGSGLSGGSMTGGDLTYHPSTYEKLVVAQNEMPQTKYGRYLEGHEQNNLHMMYKLM